MDRHDQRSLKHSWQLIISSFNHIKSISIITALVIMLATHTNAQLRIGVEAGINNNYLRAAIPHDTEMKPGVAVNAGFVIQYPINDWLAITAIPGIQQKKYAINRTGAFTGVGETKTNLYIQLPVMATVQWKIKNMALYVNAGLYGAYWAAARQRGTIPDIFHSIDSMGDDGQIHSSLVLASYNIKYPFDKRKDNRYEFGWITGIGTAYSVYNNWRVFAEARMYDAITGMQKKYMISQEQQYNRTISIMAGCIMTIKRKDNTK
jgi:hypothetical protein